MLLQRTRIQFPAPYGALIPSSKGSEVLIFRCIRHTPVVSMHTYIQANHSYT